jgi:hypothetical protein
MGVQFKQSKVQVRPRSGRADAAGVGVGGIDEDSQRVVACGWSRGDAAHGVMGRPWERYLVPNLIQDLLGSLRRKPKSQKFRRPPPITTELVHP